MARGVAGPSPLGLWRFGQTTGTTASNEIAGGLAATLFNGAAFNASGRQGGGARLDDVIDLVQVNHAGVYAPAAGAVRALCLSSIEYPAAFEEVPAFGVPPIAGPRTLAIRGLSISSTSHTSRRPSRALSACASPRWVCDIQAISPPAQNAAPCPVKTTTSLARSSSAQRNTWPSS